jgi:hypothetical protein
VAAVGFIGPDAVGQLGLIHLAVVIFVAGALLALRGIMPSAEAEHLAGQSSGGPAHR